LIRDENLQKQEGRWIEYPEPIVPVEIVSTPARHYPDDKYSPSALLLGFTVAGRPLHFQVAFDDSEMSKIITIYQPDPNEWLEFRKRGGHV